MLKKKHGYSVIESSLISVWFGSCLKSKLIVSNPLGAVIQGTASRDAVLDTFRVSWSCIFFQDFWHSNSVSSRSQYRGKNENN